VVLFRNSDPIATSHKWTARLCLTRFNDPLHSLIFCDCSLPDLLLLSLVYNQVVDKPVEVSGVLLGARAALLLLTSPFLLDEIVKEEHRGSLYCRGYAPTQLLDK
jgi:hypothetical protein